MKNIKDRLLKTNTKQNYGGNEQNKKEEHQIVSQ